MPGLLLYLQFTRVFRYVNCYNYCMFGKCERCPNPVREGGRGRPQRYCCSACRQAAFRSRHNYDRIPKAMRYRSRWCCRVGGRPVQVDGRSVSVTDFRTWGEFMNVTGSNLGDGVGFIVGDGIGCLSVNRAVESGRLVPAAVALIRQEVTDVIYSERSVGGRGLNVFYLAPPAAVRVVRKENMKAEFCTQARFIPISGDGIEVPYE